MTTEGTLTVEWVCGEDAAKAYTTRVEKDGGKVLKTLPFVPKADEADLYSDAQFEPLVIVGAVLASGLMLRYVRELVSDLKGREVVVIDLSSETPQVRVVPVGRASQVVVKRPDGSTDRFATSDFDKIEQKLAEMIP